MRQSHDRSVIPGGFSGGDEPDGSAKFITAFFRNARGQRGVPCALLEQRDGLMCGICNGFQALIKLGLVPFGEDCRHRRELPHADLQHHRPPRSPRMVRTRVGLQRSPPGMSQTRVGRSTPSPFPTAKAASGQTRPPWTRLAKNGQIASQYVDLDGNPTMDIAHNPNGSAAAVECITSPDGRVLGKMAHVERIGPGLYKNVPGRYDMGLFRSAVAYLGGR